MDMSKSVAVRGNVSKSAVERVVMIVIGVVMSVVIGDFHRDRVFRGSSLGGHSWS